MAWLDFPIEISSSLVVAALLMGYFGFGGLAFAARYVLFGRYIDPEIEQRGSSAVLILLLRLYFAWLMQPPLAVLTRFRIPPNAVTGLSVLLAVMAGIAVACGDFAVGGWAYLGSGFCDFLDGRLARVTRHTSRAGSLLDSTLDRYSESAMLIGMTWYYRHHWAMLIFLFFLTGSFLVPYLRARGEALGIDTKVGLMQRPERLVVLGLASAVSPILQFGYPTYSQSFVEHPLVVVVGALLALSTQWTAAHRLRYLIHQIDGSKGESSLARKGSGQLALKFTAISAMDLVLFVVLVQQAGWPTWLAASLSSLLPSLFLLVRAKKSEASPSAFAGILAAGLLTAGMMAMLASIPGLDFRINWFLTRISVTLGWIYPLWLSMKAPQRID